MGEARDEATRQHLGYVINHRLWPDVDITNRLLIADMATGRSRAPESIERLLFELSLRDDKLARIVDEYEAALSKGTLGGTWAAGTGRPYELVIWECPQCGYSEPGDRDGPRLDGFCSDHGDLEPRP